MKMSKLKKSRHSPVPRLPIGPDGIEPTVTTNRRSIRHFTSRRLLGEPVGVKRVSYLHVLLWGPALSAFVRGHDERL